MGLIEVSADDSTDDLSLVLDQGLENLGFGRCPCRSKCYLGVLLDEPLELLAQLGIGANDLHVLPFVLVSQC